jgi:anaerobic selenocysteine-containing dehydrogenase
VATLDDALLAGCIQLPTGAWFDPLDDSPAPTCLAGNPNALTRDRGTSSLAQGCTGQLTLVEVELAADAPAPRGPRGPAVSRPSSRAEAGDAPAV